MVLVFDVATGLAANQQHVLQIYFTGRDFSSTAKYHHIMKYACSHSYSITKGHQYYHNLIYIKFSFILYTTESASSKMNLFGRAGRK